MPLNHVKLFSLFLSILPPSSSRFVVYFIFQLWFFLIQETAWSTSSIYFSLYSHLVCGSFHFFSSHIRSIFLFGPWMCVCVLNSRKMKAVVLYTQTMHIEYFAPQPQFSIDVTFFCAAPALNQSLFAATYNIQQSKHCTVRVTAFLFILHYCFVYFTLYL